jgi:hypothetical protein
MRFLILNTDYPEFLRWLYAGRPGLEREPYSVQSRVRCESLFGMADFYSRALQTLGHEAVEIYANNEAAQKTWAREHGVNGNGSRWEYRLRRGFVPWITRSSTWFSDILSAQIASYRPDVILNLAIEDIPGRLLKENRGSASLLVGQHAAPLLPDEDIASYDLLLSSLPNLVEYFRQNGLTAQLQRLAFEPRVLDAITTAPQKIPVSFVGSLTSGHKARLQLLEAVCTRCDLSVWGNGIDQVPRDAALRAHHRGAAWAKDMYQVLHDSKITVNHHIDIAGNYANNLRLFEATGVGTLLLTDAKVNLHEMFTPGREVATYRSADECCELIEHYLSHEAERQSVASAGQQRTLAQHTYHHRAAELVDIVGAHV